MIFSGSVLHLLHILCLSGVCEMLFWYYSISICLYIGALAYCICHLQKQFERLYRAGETMHSGGLCAVDNTGYMPYEGSQETNL